MLDRHLQAQVLGRTPALQEHHLPPVCHEGFSHQGSVESSAASHTRVFNHSLVLVAHREEKKDLPGCMLNFGPSKNRNHMGIRHLSFRRQQLLQNQRTKGVTAEVAIANEHDFGAVVGFSGPWMLLSCPGRGITWTRCSLCY